MEKVLKEKDIVTLQGGHQFLVLKTLSFNDENYALLTTSDNSNNFKNIIVCEKIKDDELYLDILTDEKILEQVLSEFKK